MLITASVLLVGFIYEGVKPMIADNRDFTCYYYISKAAANYAKKNNGRLPASLSDMVGAGFLPERSYMYVAWLHDRPREEVSYKDSSFIFDPEGKNKAEFGFAYVYRVDDKYKPIVRGARNSASLANALVEGKSEE